MQHHPLGKYWKHFPMVKLLVEQDHMWPSLKSIDAGLIAALHNCVKLPKNCLRTLALVQVGWRYLALLAEDRIPQVKRQHPSVPTVFAKVERYLCTDGEVELRPHWVSDPVELIHDEKTLGETLQYPCPHACLRLQSRPLALGEPLRLTAVSGLAVGGIGCSSTSAGVCCVVTQRHKELYKLQDDGLDG